MSRNTLQFSSFSSAWSRRSGRARLSLLCGAAAILGAAGWQMARATNATFVVNSTADTPDPTPGDGICGASVGPCTLRAAIQEANAQAGADTITFNIPGAGVKTIAPGFPGLPPITSPVTIDGTTQPGSRVNTLAVGDNAVINIEISGAMAGDNVDALDFRDGSGGSLARGLAINGFSGSSAQILGNNIAVEGCFLGTNAAGTAASRNLFGIDIGYGLGAPSGNCRIGGPAPAQRNIIADSIFLSSPLPNTIQGNYIGTDKTGSVALNTSTGIVCSNGGGGPDIAGATIGGPTGRPGTGAGNVISGNVNGGIRLTASGRKIGAFSIQGNIIGLNALGSTALPNTRGQGIFIEDANVTGATGGEQSSLGPVTIGGTADGARNVISGNEGDGILAAANGVTIQGNFIGTDISGALDRGNGANGIAVTGASGAPSGVGGRSGSVLIGGPSTSARNVISGNDQGGIGVDVSNATIQSNYIGVGADGTTPVGNRAHGIVVRSTFGGAGATVNAIIGGANAGEGNTIAFSEANGVIFENTSSGSVRGNSIINNGNRGVVLDGTSAEAVIRIPILGNSIFNNGTAAAGNPGLGLGIDLIGVFGVNANDVGDADSGPNNLQNFPIITGVTGNVIRGTLNSRAGQTYRVEFFANDTDPSKPGASQTFLGFQNVTTNASGNVSFAFTSPSSLAGKAISATATDATGNTSEFSAAVGGSIVTPTPTPQPTATPIPQPTATPRPQPTSTPRPQPTATPRPQPTATPRPQPTATPRPQPTATPGPQPTATPGPTATPAPAPAFTITVGNLVRVGPYVPGLYRRTTRFSQRVTIRNNGTLAIRVPLFLVLEDLPAGAELLNRSGVTSQAPEGQPFIRIGAGSDNVLSAGETASVPLQFRARGEVRPSFTPRVQLGPNLP